MTYTLNEIEHRIGELAGIIENEYELFQTWISEQASQLSALEDSMPPDIKEELETIVVGLAAETVDEYLPRLYDLEAEIQKRQTKRTRP